MHVLGIDGGGSHTRALLCDASGQILGRGLSAGINPQVTSQEDLRAHIRSAIEQSTQSVSTPNIRAIHLGVAGASDQQTRAIIARIVREHMPAEGLAVTVSHDLEIALLGGLGGESSGIVLVAGTGSACYGLNAAGQSAQSGGWGDLVDDVGSGSWFGLRALQACVRQADGRLPASSLKQQVMDFLQINTMDAFKARIHLKGLSRNERAQLAPIMLNLAASGDLAAVSAVSEGVNELGDLIANTNQQLHLTEPLTVLAGGLMADQYLHTQLENRLREILPEAKTTHPRLSAAGGAILLALKSAKIDADKGVIHKLAADR